MRIGSGGNLTRHLHSTDKDANRQPPDSIAADLPQAGAVETSAAPPYLLFRREDGMGRRAASADVERQTRKRGASALRLPFVPSGFGQARGSITVSILRFD